MIGIQRFLDKCSLNQPDHVQNKNMNSGQIFEHLKHLHHEKKQYCIYYRPNVGFHK